jgi:general stress protein 26
LGSAIGVRAKLAKLDTPRGTQRYGQRLIGIGRRLLKRKEFPMTIDIRDKAAVERRLWDDLEKTRFGMLGVDGPSGRHFAPMTAFVERESGKVWFFTSNETELAKAAQAGAAAMFIVMAKDQELQACIGGQLTASVDDLHRDKYWSPMVAAWFPKGKADPTLTLLCLTCKDADVWLSEQGPVKFGFEIAKANLTGATPDVGAHASLTFN